MVSDDKAAEVSELDLLTIPCYSRWFSWDSIHEMEKLHHVDFFDSSTLSKTPKIYKQYRDFIINKYREDPSRRLTFTEIRKYLIGDVSSLYKIFQFLEQWGLINFSAGSRPRDDEGRDDMVIKVDEWPQNAVRVVEYPNSSKTVANFSAGAGNSWESPESDFKILPLASYSDVFDEALKSVCRNCKESCAAGYYESSKEGGSMLCADCYHKDISEDKITEEYKLKVPSGQSANNGATTWTSAETALLLEGVMKSGDDWDLVVQSLQGKSKFDCISHFLQLPFGEHMTFSGRKAGASDPRGALEEFDAVKIEPGENVKIDGHNLENSDVNENSEEKAVIAPLRKRRCLASFEYTSDSLMKQVASLLAAVAPHVAAASAKAAIEALQNETTLPEKIFGAENDAFQFGYHAMKEECVRVVKLKNCEAEIKHEYSETTESTQEIKPISLSQLRAATATALGALAARAKLLSDQEEREIESLVASMIDLQMKKVQLKMKYLKELEFIMEKEYKGMQKLKELFLGKRIDMLRRIFTLSVPRCSGVVETATTVP